MAVVARFHILGSRLDRGLHHCVLVARVGGIKDLALAVEHEADCAGLGQIAAVLGEDRADVGRRAVLVVGHRLDDHRDAAGAIALIADLVIVLGVSAHGLLDGAFDHVLRHRLALRLLDREAQARVLLRVGVAHLRGDGDFLRQLGEKFRTRGVLTPFAMLNIRPFGMAGHVPSSMRDCPVGRAYSPVTRARKGGSGEMRSARGQGSSADPAA